MTKEELTALGLTDEQADKVLSMRGKELNDVKKDLKTAETERDNLREQLQAANDTLKKFEGYSEEDLKNFETLKTDVTNYKKQVADLEKSHQRELLDRDQNDWLKAQFDEYGVASPYARKSLSSEIKDEKTGLKWKDGAFQGFDDYMKKAKESDVSLYKTKEEKEAEALEQETHANSPYFTTSNNGNSGSTSSSVTASVPVIF